MTLQEIEAALREVKMTLTSGADYWPYVYLANALKAERERIEALLQEKDRGPMLAAYPCQCSQPVQSTAMYTCGRCGGRMRP